MNKRHSLSAENGSTVTATIWNKCAVFLLSHQAARGTCPARSTFRGAEANSNLPVLEVDSDEIDHGLPIEIDIYKSASGVACIRA
jgi:hypothetical protein